MDANMDRPTCETCVYWFRIGNGLAGYCRRHPPKKAVQTERTDWCGEHHLFPAYLASLQTPACHKCGQPVGANRPDLYRIDPVCAECMIAAGRGEVAYGDAAWKETRIITDTSTNATMRTD